MYFLEFHEHKLLQKVCESETCGPNGALVVQQHQQGNIS